MTAATFGSSFSDAKMDDKLSQTSELKQFNRSGRLMDTITTSCPNLAMLGAIARPPAAAAAAHQTSWSLDLVGLYYCARKRNAAH
jgi:hypothetical protein